MSHTVEKLEHNMAKITVTVSAEDFDKALKESYNKNKAKYAIHGFRKGHAPQQMIEKVYGEGAFYEGAVDICIDKTYPEAVKESELEIVSRPEMDITQIGKGKDLIYTASVALRPEVTLGEYKGVEVKKADTAITDEDIEGALKSEQEKNSRLITVEDRAAELGDQTLIDFDGSIDGVPFDGGKGEKYPLELGSHSFIEGFEEQIVGHKIDDEFDVNVTFPKEYHAESLAGKPAVFKVKLLEIKKKELPALDDEFASEISEFNTLAEYKEDLKKKLSEAKAKRATVENENNVVEKVVENATLDIPDPMVDYQVNNMIRDYAQRMQGQGISLEDYMKYTGTTLEALKEQMKPQAIKRIQTRLVLEAVAKAENIKGSDEAVDTQIQNMAKQYSMEEEKVREYLGEAGINQMKEDQAVQATVDFLVAEAKLV